MKKAKQTAAIIAIVLLIGMYVLTLILALTDHSETQAMLKASLYSTMVIPVMLYVFIFLTRMFKNKSKENLEVLSQKSDTSEAREDISE